MPHRVADFFRSHSNNFDIIPADFKKAPRRSSSSQRRPALSDRSPSSSASSVSSDHSFKMPEHKRLSLQGLSLGSHTPKSSSSKNPHAPLELAIKIESPPLVFYGPAATSTGALLSGQFLLHVHEEPAIIENFKLRLVVETTRKKPFHSHCAECAQQTNELTKWEFHQGQTTLNNGSHDYPFSFLFPGHLPASMNSSLVKIDYVLKGTVTPKGGEPIKISKTLNIQRALTPADAPKKSIRIFPPTNLTANCTLPPVIHPIGDSNLTMRLDGVVKKNEDAKTQTQWRLKRMTWRLDEVHKEISPACPKHLAKLALSEEQARDMKKKGTPHESVRTLNSEELKSGWKADYSAEAGGSIDMEFAFSIKPDAHPICDMKTEDGTEVSHILIVEMIVAEEFAPIAKPTQVTPTGAARVLRMHFTTIVTERSGLGISWDEEQPPLYENVPASPPSYGHVLDLEISDQELPDYESLPALDSLTLNTQHASTTLAPPPPAHLSPDPRRSDEHGL